MVKIRLNAIIFILMTFLVVGITACSPELVTVSNNKTPAQSKSAVANSTVNNTSDSSATDTSTTNDSLTKQLVQQTAAENEGISSRFALLMSSGLGNEHNIKDSPITNIKKHPTKVNKSISPKKNSPQDPPTTIQKTEITASEDYNDGESSKANEQPGAFSFINTIPAKELVPTDITDTNDQTDAPTNPPASAQTPPPSKAPIKKDKPASSAQEHKEPKKPKKMRQNRMCIEREKTEPNACLKPLQPTTNQSVGYYAKIDAFKDICFYKGKRINIDDLPEGEKCSYGALVNATELPLVDGYGYHIRANSKNHRYGTDHMILFIYEMVRTALDNKLTNELIIGDISNRRGGYLGNETIGHKSHQNGLDVDIGYITQNEDPSNRDRFPGNLISNNRLDLRKFNVDKNFKFAEEAVATGDTTFILVHPTIKEAFCEKAKSTGEFEKFVPFLSQIIPDKTHYNHFHIRLKCPESSPFCIPGPPRKVDDGCEEALASLRHQNSRESNNGAQDNGT